MHKLAYPIAIDTSWQLLNEKINSISPSQIIIICDENTKHHCVPIVKQHLALDVSLIIVPAGEAHKNLGSCTFIWNELVKKRTDRKALILNVGGGVIGDMGGFCAATFKRGLRFIQIPTTLLSMVDASVGGKLGVDFGALKNMIGTFCDPEMVFIHSKFLLTLDKRQIRSGFAEIIKHALIKDKQYWNELCKIQEPENYSDWSSLISQSIEIKKDIVLQDPLENGLRKILNYGHTVGHALESHSLSTTSPLLHGEAIAWGMIIENELAVKLGLLDEIKSEEINGKIKTWFDITAFDKPKVSLLDIIKADKKNESNKVLCSLLKDIGDCAYNVAVTDEILEQCIPKQNE